MGRAVYPYARGLYPLPLPLEYMKRLYPCLYDAIGYIEQASTQYLTARRI